MMNVPGTFTKSSLLREVEHLRLLPGEVLILRFSENVRQEEMQGFAQQLHEGFLRGRVMCMQFDGEMVVAEK